jgi:allophanate hydrolase subunit 2
VRVIWGPQDDHFTDAARETLTSCAYTVAASSDRMGYRLEGDRLEHRGASQILSDGNAPGSIQVPPDGLPIVLLADRATTGGYPKIATVVRADIPKLAQKLPGGRVRFAAGPASGD